MPVYSEKTFSVSIFRFQFQLQNCHFVFNQFLVQIFENKKQIENKVEVL